jgi:DNA-binding response OmpR family regulator
MVVEDDPLIALDIHDALCAAGATVTRAGNALDALRQLDRARVSAAVVDVGLGASDCSSVCEALAERGIPFAFYTGYSGGALIERWGDAPVLQKPAEPRSIVAAVARLLAPAGGEPTLRDAPRGLDGRM